MKWHHITSLMWCFLDQIDVNVNESIEQIEVKFYPIEKHEKIIQIETTRKNSQTHKRHFILW